MPLLSCPKDERLFELVSIPDEVSFVDRLQLKAHLVGCTGCQQKATAIRKNWETCFIPEPDITGSLMKIYSRLQKDETLILKGWKLSPTRPMSPSMRLIKEGWLFRGAVATAAAAAFFIVPWSQFSGQKAPDVMVYNHSASMGQKPPLAQFRVENKNSIKVHYIEPELLQSIEFETTNTR